MIRVRFLGHFEVLCDGRIVPFKCNSKAQTIFKWLVIKRPQPVPGDYLKGWLWPESNQKKASWSLNSTIYILRKLLKNMAALGTPKNLILQDQGYYFLDPSVRVWVDKDEFESNYALGRRFEREQRTPEAISKYRAAINLYRGKYLIDDLYEDWTMIERERLSRIYISMLTSLADHYTSSQCYQESIEVCYRLLQSDRYNDNAYILLKKSYEGLGLQGGDLRERLMCNQIETIFQEY